MTDFINVNPFLLLIRNFISFHNYSLICLCILSEYTARFVPHESKLYSETTRFAIPRIYSTALDRTNAINKDMNYRSLTYRRLPTTRDVQDIEYMRSFQRDVSIPRSYYYLGKVPDTIDNKTRDNFPFLPAPVNSIHQIKSTTIEKLPNQQEQTVFA